MQNAEVDVVRDFGREWEAFDQRALSDHERRRMFDEYFAVFPWELLSRDAVGFDAGCGTGRWAVLVAPRVGRLHCADPSSALDVAKQNLRALPNCEFHRAVVDELPFADETMDFGYCLGVLHHVPDTAAGIVACVRKLKRGAPFLLYLYYAFDNQPPWYRTLWRVSNGIRAIVSRMPFGLKYVISQAFALAVYYPLARGARLAEKMGIVVHSFPLSAYRDRSLYSMRTDALDRFGTRLEKRFTAAQISEMMAAAGLRDIRFSNRVPFWCAVGVKA